MDQHHEQMEDEEQPGFWLALGKAISIGIGAGLLGFAAGVGFHAATNWMSKDKTQG